MQTPGRRPGVFRSFAAEKRIDPVRKGCGSWKKIRRADKRTEYFAFLSELTKIFNLFSLFFFTKFVDGTGRLCYNKTHKSDDEDGRETLTTESRRMVQAGVKDPAGPISSEPKAGNLF